MNLVSLKFSPGLYPEIITLQKCFNASGSKGVAYLHKSYAPMVENNDHSFVKIITLRVFFELIFDYRVRVFYFYNNSPLHIFFLLVRKLYGKHEFSSAVHEPPRGSQVVGEGLVARFYRSASSVLTGFQLLLCDAVVVFSSRGHQLLLSAYPRICKRKNVIEARLLKERVWRKQIGGRSSLAYVGRINVYKKPDSLVGLCESLKYDLTIITSSMAASTLSCSSNVTIRFKNVLSETVLQEELSGNLAVVCPQEDVVQSGVVVTGLCCSVPVIALDAPGFREQVRHLETGYLLNEWCESELARAKRYVLENYSQMVRNCDADFYSNYDPENFLKYYGDIV